MIRDFGIIVDVAAPNAKDAEAIIHEYLSPIVCNDLRFDADILTGSKTTGGKKTIWDPAPGSLQVPVELAVVGLDPELTIKDVCAKFMVMCPDVTDWHWSDRHQSLMKAGMRRGKSLVSKKLRKA